MSESEQWQRTYARGNVRILLDPFICGLTMPMPVFNRPASIQACSSSVVLRPHPRGDQVGWQTTDDI